ncbi:MAG: ACP S-malonyltransferase [Gammaproteobacteria bacterium]|nr:ACP S-malonyltransferase [Gammaproteobacteria bacterium]
MNSANNTLAMVFPGQGSQSVGMLAELAAGYPQVEDTFAEASAALGYDLWQLVQSGPEEMLNQTDRTQPAMLAAGVAVWRVWQQHGGMQPALMAGHSLGEYTALVCAGALDFAAAIALVAERGRCMQSAVPAGVGAMAAVLGLDDAAVAAVCAESAGDEIVSPVNFNSPGQVVIAGHAGAVERAVVAAKAAGAKRAVTLPVSVPSHCALMEPAAQAFATHLAETVIQQPTIPVLQNVDAAAHDQADDIRDNLARQLYNPVQWVMTVHAMRAQGIERIVEAGPGKVLAGLCKRIDKGIANAAVYDPASLDKALANNE